MPDFVPTYDPNEPLPANVDPSLAGAAQSYLNGPAGAAFNAVPADPVTVATAPAPLINTTPELATDPATGIVAPLALPSAPTGIAAPPVTTPAPGAAPTAQDASPQPAPAPQGPAPHVGGGGGGMAGLGLTTAQKVEDVASKENHEQLTQDQLDQAAHVTDFNKIAAQQKADSDKAEAEEKARQAKVTDDAINWGNKFVSDAQSHVTNASQEYQSALEEDKTHTIFTGKSTWQKAGAWLGLALGAIGAGFSAAGGHPTGNLAVTQLNKEIEDDFSKQRARIGDLKDSVAMAQTGLKNANDAKTSLLLDVEAKRKAVYDSLEAQARANASGLGVQAAALDGSNLMLTIKKGQLDATDSTTRIARADALTRVKTAAEVAKDKAEANNANAMASYHRAMAGNVGALAGGDIPAPGSKVDNAIMSKYVNPKRKDAEGGQTRIKLLNQSMAELDDPNLTYGGAKQALINGFQASGGNPKGRIAVADIKEVMPEMQSIPDEVITHILQGGSGKVSPEYRKTVKNTLAPKAAAWTKDYQDSGDEFERNLPVNGAAAKSYRNQIYPVMGSPAVTPAPAASYPIGTKAKNKAGQPVVMTASGWQAQ